MKPAKEYVKTSARLIIDRVRQTEGAKVDWLLVKKKKNTFTD